MDYVLPVVLLLIGLAIGTGSMWLLVRAKIEHAFGRGRGQSQSDQAVALERLSARDQTIERLQSELDQRQVHLQDAHEKTIVLQRSESELQTRLNEVRKQAQEKLAVLDDAQKKLSDAFKALAAEALKSNNQSFLQLAKTNLETFQKSAQTDLDQRRKSIDELVKPVKLSLDKFDVKLQDVEKARVDAYRGITEQVKTLAQSNKDLKGETSELVNALKKPQVRGRWGEMQLRRVVELAGMLDHCDFHEQQVGDSNDTRLRPDMVVHMAGNKTIIIDSKAPLAAFLEAVEAKDDEARAERLRAHARNVRARVEELGKKSYFEQFDDTPELVVLFLPGEALFSAAMEHDPHLIEMSAKMKVMISSPTTLITMLKAVYHGWRQERLAENAREISDLGKELFDRLATMSGHLAKLGKGLQSATDYFNKTVVTFETRVMVSARRFKELDAAPADGKLDEIQPIEIATRGVQVSEAIEEDNVGSAGNARQISPR